MEWKVRTDEGQLANSMPPMLDRRMLKTYVIIILLYFLLVAMTFWPIFLNISNTIFDGSDYADAYQTLWNLWWVKYSVVRLHANFYYTKLVFYPIGANLITQTLSPLAGVLTAPLQAVSLAFAYNAIFILGYVLSGLFMFMLAYYLTGNKYAAFIAGLVFAFAPMHIAQSYGHLNWTSIEFLPLFVLFLLLSIKESKIRYATLAAISFLFITFFADVEQ